MAAPRLAPHGAAKAPKTHPRGDGPALYTELNARLVIAVKQVLKGQTVPLAPCLTEGCNCAGIYFKEVFTTTSTMVVSVVLNTDDCADEAAAAAALAQFGRNTPGLVLTFRSPEGGLVTHSTPGDFTVATEQVAGNEWAITFRPAIVTNRRLAQCTLAVVADDVNMVETIVEVRSKPAGWLVVENIPLDWNMGALQAFLATFLRKQHYTHVHSSYNTPGTAFIKLATRPRATGSMEAWLRTRGTYTGAHADIAVSWCLNVTRAFKTEQPFGRGSGWKAPAKCRRAGAAAVQGAAALKTVTPAGVYAAANPAAAITVKAHPQAQAKQARARTKRAAPDTDVEEFAGDELTNTVTTNTNTNTSKRARGAATDCCAAHYDAADNFFVAAAETGTTVMATGAAAGAGAGYGAGFGAGFGAGAAFGDASPVAAAAAAAAAASPTATATAAELAAQVAAVDYGTAFALAEVTLPVFVTAPAGGMEAVSPTCSDGFMLPINLAYDEGFGATGGMPTTPNSVFSTDSAATNAPAHKATKGNGNGNQKAAFMDFEYTMPVNVTLDAPTTADDEMLPDFFEAAF